MWHRLVVVATSHTGAVATDAGAARARKTVIVIFNASTLVGGSIATLATSSCTESIKFGWQLGLRLDERAAVVTHWLVASVWVLGEESERRGDDEHDEKDQCEDGIEYKEDDTADTSDDTGLTEDASEDEQEDGVDEVDHHDGNVECIGLLVHERCEDADGNEVNTVNDGECDGLGNRAALTETDKHALEQDVDERKDDPVVCGSLV